MSVGDEQDQKADLRYRLTIVAYVVAAAVMVGLTVVGGLWVASRADRVDSAAPLAVPAVQSKLTPLQREELDELRMLQMMVSANPQERAIQKAIRERRVGIAILNQNLAWQILQADTPNLEWCAQLLNDPVLLGIPEHRENHKETLDLYEKSR